MIRRDNFNKTKKWSIWETQAGNFLLKIYRKKMLTNSADRIQNTEQTLKWRRNFMSQEVARIITLWRWAQEVWSGV